MDTSKYHKLIAHKLTDLQSLQRQAEKGCEVVSLDQTRVGRLSRMDAMQSQAMNQAAQLRRSIQIKQLEQALCALKNNDYGYCQNCDEFISEGRLLFDPSVTLCIDCATKLEND